CLPYGLSSVSTIRQASIVTNITTSCGFRIVRVGKRNSARNAAGNRATALGWIGLRRIGSSSPVAAIGLGIRRLHPNGHSQNAHACDTGQSAYTHHQRGSSALKTSATLARCRRQVPACRSLRRVGAITYPQIANSVDIMPGSRELIALTLLAALGCGLALAHGDFLFVAVFGGAIAMTIETIRRFP